ncbi:MAG: glycosyltransferase, partial [Acidimicrobiia bacterium]|nr:glycosyltransferase [Acidimicrobiia bacterium]
RDIGFLKPECPVVHADPDNLEQVLRALLADRQSWDARARAGREYVDSYHNGEATARILEPFLSKD